MRLSTNAVLLVCWMAKVGVEEVKNTSQELFKHGSASVCSMKSKPTKPFPYQPIERRKEGSNRKYKQTAPVTWVHSVFLTPSLQVLRVNAASFSFL